MHCIGKKRGELEAPEHIIFSEFGSCDMIHRQRTENGAGGQAPALLEEAWAVKKFEW
jgi:hypothetical protein